MTRKCNEIMDELNGRIKNYYDAINNGSFMAAHAMIDLDLYDSFGDTGEHLLMHKQMLETWQHLVGKVEVLDIVMNVHMGEKLPTYRGRDYAIGRTTWKDDKGFIHFFSEHWVKGERSWFTQNITPKS
jgi:hypothetical protein